MSICSRYRSACEPGSESWLDSMTTSTTSPSGSSRSMKMSKRFSAETEAARTGILLPLSGSQ